MNPKARQVVQAEWRGATLPDEDAHPPADLRSILDRVFVRLGFSERLRETTLVETWSELVGPALAPHCRPKGIRRGILNIGVDHPAWLHQINMAHKKDILRLVQQRFPHLKIKDLQLRIESMRRALPHE
jgi:predicted nucleic acid-binding Zn ribbon protein